MKAGKVVISGASGFLGKNILRSYAGDIQMIALTTDVNKLAEFNLYPEIIVMENKEYLESDLHLKGATLLNLAYGRSHDYEQVKSSLDFTSALIKKSIELEVDKIINISSQSVYNSNRIFPAKEDDLVLPSNLYGIGKYYIEKWIEDACKINDVRYVNLRIASLIGHEMKERLINRLIASSLANGQINIEEKNHIFSFTHVQDIVEALFFMFESETKIKWGEVYNVGNDEKYLLHDIGMTIAEQVLEKTGRKVELNVKYINTMMNQNNSINIDKFRDMSGWIPKYSLCDIVSQEIDHQIRGQHNV